MTSVHPIAFRRSRRSKVLVILAGIAVVPVMTVLLTAVLGSAAVAVLVLSAVPEKQAAAVYVVLFPLVGIGMVVSAIRRYRRDVRTAVLIYPHGLVLETPEERRAIPFDEIENVRLVPKRLDAVCMVELEDGSSVALPFHIASFATVREAFEATIVGELARKLGQRLREGKTVHLRESSLRAMGRLPYCLVMIFAGLVLMLSVRGLLSGAIVIRNGFAHGKRGWRGRNADFVISREGINRDPQWPSAMHTWSELENLCVDQAGMVLRFAGGRVLSASIFAENFWPLAVWISQAWEEGRGRDGR